MNNIKILSTGKALADKVLTNDDLSLMVDTSDEWIYSRTGIKQRYVVENKTTLDLAYEASIDALKAMDKNKIRLIIVATITPDYSTPSTACLLQAKLGLNGQEVMAFDINAACSGFVYAMQVGSSLLKDGEQALIIGAESLSKIVDFKDRNTCVLFGDGAGAVVIEKSLNHPLMYHYAKSIGDDQGVLYAKNDNDKLGKLQMDGRQVFRFAVDALEQGVKKVLTQANMDISEIDLIIPHQANSRIIDYTTKKLGVSADKFFVNLEKYGNTSAASVPLALAEANEQNLLKPKMKVILVGFGAGFTYGSTLIEW